MKIHPTAIVHPDAELAEDVEIQPYAIIGPRVRIGKGTVVGPHCVFGGDTVIGERNRFFPGGQIGAPSQDLKSAPGLEGRLRIGNDNVIREFVTLTVNTMRDESETHRATTIGNNNLLMCYVHLGHDCKIGNNTVLASYAGLSGHVEVHDYANVGGLTAIHQFVRIGTYAFIGGSSGVAKDCMPYMLSSGFPCRCHGPNLVGLERGGIDKEARARVKEMYRILCRSNLNTKQALDEIRRTVEDCEQRRGLIEFVESSERGVTK